jgi:Gas vesicle synthesis protein GvpL/GvpF
MNVLVYGISDGADLEVSGAGLNEQRLRGVGIGSVGAFVSDHDGRPPDPTVQALWEYEQAVERLAQRRPLLPARFASVLADDDAVREMLNGRREQLTAALDRIRGAVELALCADWSRPPQPDSSSRSGIAYMRSRLELRSRAREVAAALEPLGALSRNCRRDLAARSSVGLRCAYLVDRERLHEFTTVVAQLGDRLPDIELVCTGPWPVYSFAEGASA